MFHEISGLTGESQAHSSVVSGKDVYAFQMVPDF